MTLKAKRFRIGVEGATTDGRTVQREWIQQMADNYNPELYTALINLEHIKAYSPDSPFRRYGYVTKLTAEEIPSGPLVGKLGLYADVNATPDLVGLTEQWQKMFTSMEIDTEFADIEQAYLVGLAATDNPASLGTEMMMFSANAQHNPLASRKIRPKNLFTAAEETQIEWCDEPDDKPSLLARISALFSQKAQGDDSRFADVHQAVELVAQEQQRLNKRTTSALEMLTQQARQQGERLDNLESALQQQQQAFTQLRQQLGQENSWTNRRPAATGASGGEPETALTNC
ncbi:GPO family capsid scaffolding protein [Edwardsiella tarda]|uniref:GPO family capsid scaffolding protein n=1 Tax=Edwardsiella tarda TaxID=636 RepID=UPI00098F82EE|nr:GPO family capsid scaffolding protein [Edwardsiella tarda]